MNEFLFHRKYFSRTKWAVNDIWCMGTKRKKEKEKENSSVSNPYCLVICGNTSDKGAFGIQIYAFSRGLWRTVRHTLSVAVTLARTWKSSLPKVRSSSRISFAIVLRSQSISTFKIEFALVSLPICFWSMFLLTGMAIKLGFVIVIALTVVSICGAAIFRPISDSHRSAALELFTLSDGSLGRLVELNAYYSVWMGERSYQIT